MRLERLGLGDWVNGCGSLGLLVVLFAVPWFGYQIRFGALLGHGDGVMTAAFGHYRANGWQTFTVLGPLTLVVCALGLCVWGLYATRPSPAVPMALMVLQAPLAGLLALALAVRVLIDQPQVLLQGRAGPNALEALPGAYLGLALSVVIVTGVYRSFRREGVAPGDAPAEIETLDVSGAPSASRA